MRGKRAARLVALAVLASLPAFWLAAADKAPPADPNTAFQQGNFRDAYNALHARLLNPNTPAQLLARDLDLAIQSLRNLGRTDEVDPLLHSVLTLHNKHWLVLQAAALAYTSPNLEHYGYLVAGKFSRGPHRGGGRQVGSYERDRTQALQLLHKALTLCSKDNDKAACAQLHVHFADVLLAGAGQHDPWRLQYLTDLDKLPDYQQDAWWPWQQNSQRGAPVDADGKPVFHRLPKSYQDAQSDGQRWRWMLDQAARLDPSRQSEMDMRLAVFLHGQLGVQTMAYHGASFSSEQTSKTGPFAVHTLTDDETIARLATGIQRFGLPQEFNWIKICQRVAARSKSPAGEQARDLLAGVYENRRQLVKAAQAWKKAIAEYGPGANNHRQQRLDQIVGSWGRFEPGHELPAGQKATLEYRFRNGTKVSFEARPVDVPRLLADVKDYLKKSGGRIDWNKTNLSDIGYRLVSQNEEQYVGKLVASWQQALSPAAEHVDERISVHTPLERPGAYLVSAKMDRGNTSRVLLWLSDTVLLKKPLDGKTLYYVADARTGQPVAKANLELFGWQVSYPHNDFNRPHIDTRSFAENSDGQGQVILSDKELSQQYQWLAIARKAREPGQQDDRFAYLGFSGVWYGRLYDPDYSQTRVFLMSDRPVYRPAQKVHLKAWVRHARYDQPDVSDFAGKSFTLRVHNPRNEKVFEKSLTADGYGGISTEMELPSGAMLGVYQVAVDNLGGGSFRLEEYKKPEFEVEVEAPSEPVRLGEKVRASVRARYYFGAPVSQARVKVKVLRSSHSSQWYPLGVWDWLYGPGYWWFAADYGWYPGWREWGCKRPVPPWWGRGHEQPEVVLENETVLPADGVLPVLIDTRAARELHGDQDHEYTLTAEVTDESRRTIVGTGKVLVSRKPFEVTAWLERGHYQVGDTIAARFHAHTLAGKAVSGKGELTLYRVSYNDKSEPVEKAVQKWELDSDAQGESRQQLKASRAGQYRLSYKLKDSKGHTVEGGYLFVVRGEGIDGRSYRFNELELIPERKEYAPGQKVQLLLGSSQKDAVVLLFVRPSSGVYLPPKVVRLAGKSVTEEIAVVQKDMPNFFVEAVSVFGGQVHSEVREVVVPPQKRVLEVKVEPSAQEYRPGQKGRVKVKVTDLSGKPVVGSVVLSMYDRSVEYISGGSNVPEIREHFWSWRRHHYPHTESSLVHGVHDLLRQGETAMADLGVFGYFTGRDVLERDGKKAMPTSAAAPGKSEGSKQLALDKAGDGVFSNVALNSAASGKDEKRSNQQKEGGAAASPPAGPEPVVRQNFADTALWTSSLTTDREGTAEVPLTMPENLTGWKIKAWALTHGTRVGQADAIVTTKKDLLVRLQAPRFFLQKDEVVLSANVHNYLKSDKTATVSLESDGPTLHLLDDSSRQVLVPAGGEKRVDWRVRVETEGEAVIRVKAVTDEESDAMQLRLPCLVHGLLKTDSFSAALRPEQKSTHLSFNVPAQRRVKDTRLEVRYSPTLAGALVDALPYLADYPYGCTEQTLNRFLPSVITQRVLQRMNINLKDVAHKRTNLNAQEIGDPHKRAQGWKQGSHNPLFDDEELKNMVKAGLAKLTAMQCSDGGWGWFSGSGEQSWPHTTAVVVHGLQVARDNDVALVPGMLERGIAWLKNYQAEQLRQLQNAAGKTRPYKEHADNLDALVYKILVDEGQGNAAMRDFLYRDRTQLAVYAKALFGLALHKEQQADKLAMILENIDQYVVEDEENQTAYLKLPADNAWWLWYGNEVEAHAYYLELLSRTSPKAQKTSRLVKYLLNNRKHATYWSSTRDTALCIEALAEYLKASGEDRPDMTVELWLDGQKRKEVVINGSNLFSFDGSLVLEGEALRSGKHELEVRRKGAGPVYCNAYLTTFSQEDFIPKAGLEVKVQRRYYKLSAVEQKVKVSGSRGQAVDQKVEKYERSELASGAQLKSGDVVEVELEIESKNDYEYLVFEDAKAAGFEPVQVRSGYSANEMGAYMELRDERVCLFVRSLARGKHSVSYRLRAEIPGKFSALPTKAEAMYAPELRGNSDEIKLAITD